MKSLPEGAWLGIHLHGIGPSEQDISAGILELTGIELPLDFISIHDSGHFAMICIDRSTVKRFLVWAFQGLEVCGFPAKVTGAIRRD